MNLEELYRLLRSSHVQSQGIVDTLQEPLIVLDRDFVVSNANPAFFRTFQVERDDVLGRNVFKLGDGQWDIKELRHLLADVVPKARAIFGYQVTHDFPNIGRRKMLVSARRLQHPDENSTQMLLVFEDVTERQKADAAKDILLAETRHRMKNLMAILRAIASQTRAEGQTGEQYRDALLGRFETVMNAETLMSVPAGDTELSALIEQALRPVAGERARVDLGPPVILAEHQILPVSMILHELATNALTYGALSGAHGVIHASWTTESREARAFLSLNWKEEGGPSVSPPTRQGFGMRLIQHSARAEGGEAAFNFAPTGLQARITLPMAR